MTNAVATQLAQAAWYDPGAFSGVCFLIGLCGGMGCFETYNCQQKVTWPGSDSFYHFC